ncbi:flavin reductase family protein [Croceicoccus sediminis]|uniref:flavin reductase family protein n=1 Tax=Croceicoccus sediminis TaxID=2571150 RepID=UPI00118221F7|nr:flavin reductase family protein [Croceicoccus sediminis]
MNWHSYRSSEGHGLRHNPLKAIIGPRPIGWISTLSDSGVANLAPYSFFNMINDRPPLVMFSSTGYKDSVTNIAARGEFACNLATRPLAEQVNLTSGAFEPDVDEFERAGLAKADCMEIDVPRVADAPACLECRMVSIQQLKGLNDVKADSWMVIGEIVAVHLAEEYLADGLFQTDRAEPILRAGYAGDYWAIGSEGKFTMYRPKVDESR